MNPTHPRCSPESPTPPTKRRRSDTSDRESESDTQPGNGLKPKPAKQRRKGSAPVSDQASDGNTSAASSGGFNKMFDDPPAPTRYNSPLTIPTRTPTPHTTLQELTRDLDLALQRQWASRHQTRFSKYESVKAFLVSWEEDDLGVEEEADDLARLFEHTYSYQVEKWKIPSRNSQIALDKKVGELVGELEGPSTLLIFYYAGHARPSRQQFGSYPVWRSNRKEDAQEVIPFSIQRYLEDASCDVLFLFDCCHPIHAQSGLKTRGIKEVLAAGGFETVAAEVGNDSFSRFLIDQLARASSDWLSVSASELHGRMLTSLADYTSKLVRDQAGQIALDANNRPRFERARRRTPVHYFMSHEHESIILAPLRLAAVAGRTDPVPPVNNGDSHPMAQEIGEGIINLQPRETHPQVILSVRLDSSETLNAAPWLDWLKKAPPEAKDIKVEGWFGSFSTLVLLNVPLSIWHMLPDNPAISFIDYVTTKNLAFSVTLLPQQTQAMMQGFCLGEIGPFEQFEQLSNINPARAEEPIYYGQDDFIFPVDGDSHEYNPARVEEPIYYGQDAFMFPVDGDSREYNSDYYSRDSEIDVNSSKMDSNTSSTRTSRTTFAAPSRAQSSRYAQAEPANNTIFTTEGPMQFDPQRFLNPSNHIHRPDPRSQDEE